MRGRVSWSRLILILGLLLTLFQTSSAFKISQIEFRLSIPPGGSDTLSFTVENDETESTAVTVSLADWDRSMDGENRFFEPGTLPRSSAGWISVSPTQFELEPGEAREVRFTIDVPEGVEGTYWAAILVEGSPREVEIGGGTTIIVMKRFGVKIYETPPGTGRSDGRITKVQRLGLNPLVFLIDFENTGTVDLTVSGEVQIIDSQGQTVEVISIAQFPILPGAVREVQASGKAPRPAAGRYLALAILDFGGDYIPAGQLIFNIPALELVPIGGAANPPQDLDGDGFYEDVNGDGDLDETDPDLLEEELNSAAIQNNWPAFDFDNDGDADEDDVAALRELLAG
jgi:P pilus assembly chaperone PapD